MQRSTFFLMNEVKTKRKVGPFRLLLPDTGGLLYTVWNNWLHHFFNTFTGNPPGLGAGLVWVSNLAVIKYCCIMRWTVLYYTILRVPAIWSNGLADFHFLIIFTGHKSVRYIPFSLPLSLSLFCLSIHTRSRCCRRGTGRSLPRGVPEREKKRGDTYPLLRNTA